jgi:hypothetical protein
MPRAKFSDARIYDINSRHRTSDFKDRISLQDFDLGPPRDVNASLVASDPRWSLAGLDLDADTAIFLRLAAGTDLSTAPFVHILQHSSAEAVLTLPLEALLDLSRAVPAPDKLIFIFSMGRCGTTLVSNILAQVPGVYSLSEPDPFMSLALARFSLPLARQQALVEALTRFSYRPPEDHRYTTLALKFQSQVLFQAELFHNAFPDADNIFMYRDAASWGNSMSHFVQMLGLPMVLPPEMAKFSWMMGAAASPWQHLALTTDINAPSFTHVEVNTPVWALHIEEYQRLAALGLPVMALRYNELNSDRTGSIARLLAHCGLPASALPEALSAFDHDSQKGTAIARDHKVQSFTAEDHARLRDILAQLPSNLSPDVILDNVA